MFAGLLTCLFCLYSKGYAQISSQDLIENSLKYHDPKGILSKSGLLLSLEESRPGASVRKTELYIHPYKDEFSVSRRVDETLIEMTRMKGVNTFKLNGSTELSPEQIKEHRLDVNRLNSMKSYYRYLWYLPQTLLDPGTVMASQATASVFDGKDCFELKVTYEKEVGSDVWYYYFSKTNYQLIGYRFYHDQSKNDGEYITLEKEAVNKSLRLPSRRNWFTHADNEYLGSDEIMSITIK